VDLTEPLRLSSLCIISSGIPKIIRRERYRDAFQPMQSLVLTPSPSQSRAAFTRGGTPARTGTRRSLLVVLVVVLVFTKINDLRQSILPGFPRGDLRGVWILNAISL
jgi:hypothetical protein